MAVVRATTVARGVERQKLAARAAEAKRAALVHSWQLPITNPVKTSGFGYRWGRLHAGNDFAVSEGTPLASMSTGKVDFAGPMSGYGILVRIRYWDGTISYYGHMSRISVNKGDSVEPGEIVGRSGNTGHSTGPHLHLEIHPNGGGPVDPGPWLARHHIAS
jgi:murein DD-endopeptidase MepM/ murein hydrolase activator NlpD